MSKQKIDTAFQRAMENGGKGFVPYIMAGDGGLDHLQERIQFLEESGATVIELGIPFSDPVADGPTIQDAGHRALEEGVTLSGVLAELKKYKQDRSIPIVLMTYLNPIFVYGVEKVAKDCAEAGVDGLIIPDLPLEEESIIVDPLKVHDIALIRIAALTSTEERLEKIAGSTEGFLYAVTVSGTTGARTDFHDHLEAHLQKLQSLTSVPVLAGFGVSTPEHVKQLGSYADGVVVGSKIVDSFHNNDRESIKELISAAAVNGDLAHKG